MVISETVMNNMLGFTNYLKVKENSSIVRRSSSHLTPFVIKANHTVSKRQEDRQDIAIVYDLHSFNSNNKSITKNQELLEIKLKE